MVDTATSSADPRAGAAGSVPTVLAVLVVKDGAGWLKRCLAGLGRQTHPRLAVLAVDNGSRDDSWQLLAAALGHRRVLRLERNVGFPEAVRRALASPVAQKADFVLLLHDDTVLAPETVARLVEAAGRVPGAGVVGAKVLDAARPRVIREVGLSTDRFGYPYSPLEPDELDQGQYDTPREVLYVSSALMLISSEALAAAGPFDERLDTTHGDIDFCWRVHLAGYRVFVAPNALALHRGAGAAGARRGSRPEHRRYLIERAGLLTLLKNYRAVTLLWVLPLYFAQGLVRIAVYAVTRRFNSAGQVLAAWAWNMRNLGGTLRRRLRGRRRLRDRDVARFMAPAGARLRRWMLEASAPLVGTGAVDTEARSPGLRRRMTGFLGEHPVAVGWFAAVALSLFAFRGVLFASELQGAALPSVPDESGALFREFASGWRSTGFGGPGGASPALVPIGVASMLTFNDPALLLRLFLSVSLILPAVSCYRSLVRRGLDRTAAVTGAACYALSAVAMWAVSEGRVGTIVFVAMVPWIGGRVIEAFSARPDGVLRWVVGTGVGLAIVTSFFPAAWIAVVLFAVAATAIPERDGSRLRGVALVGAAAVVGTALIFPFAISILTAGGAAAVDAAGPPRILALLRLAPGVAPGAWPVAGFLPLAGTLAFAMTEDRRRAWRAAGGAAASILLAWLAAAGRLPAAGNPVVFVGAAAFLLATLVASATQTLTAGVHREAFGARQLAVVSLGTVVVLGLVLQAGQALGGGWAVGENRIPPAWPVVASADPGSPFRVLWLGRSGGAAFPAPGGLPDGEVTGPPSLRYGVTGRDGRPVTEIGTPAAGPAFDRLERLMTEVLLGDVRHGGALLSTMGIRYVVAGQDDLPRRALHALNGQVDLDLIQDAGGLRVFRAAVPLPVAWTSAGGAARTAARAGSLTEVARLVSDRALRGQLRGLRPIGSRAWVGTAPRDAAGVAVIGTPFDERWESIPPAPTFPAFGWAVGFIPPAEGGPVGIRFTGQWRRTVEVAALALLWAVALWVTRRGPRES